MYELYANISLFEGHIDYKLKQTARLFAIDH